MGYFIPFFLASHTFWKFPHHLKTDILDTFINWFINEANKQDPSLEDLFSTFPFPGALEDSV
jgi:hypothetical protein